MYCVSQIMRDPETGNSKGHAFINFASFEASDAAIEAMNGESPMELCSIYFHRLTSQSRDKDISLAKNN